MDRNTCQSYIEVNPQQVIDAAKTMLGYIYEWRKMDKEAFIQKRVDEHNKLCQKRVLKWFLKPVSCRDMLLSLENKNTRSISVFVQYGSINYKYSDREEDCKTLLGLAEMAKRNGQRVMKLTAADWKILNNAKGR